MYFSSKCRETHRSSKVGSRQINVLGVRWPLSPLSPLSMSSGPASWIIFLLPISCPSNPFHLLPIIWVRSFSVTDLELQKHIHIHVFFLILLFFFSGWYNFNFNGVCVRTRRLWTLLIRGHSYICKNQSVSIKLWGNIVNHSLHYGPLLAPLNGTNIELVLCWLNPSEPLYLY